MLHLRGIEKAYFDSFGDPIFYFQPQTERLDPSIRGFSLDRVVLDYSHIGPDHRSSRFVENRVSINYKLPTDLGSAEEAIAFNTSYTGRILLALPIPTEPRTPVENRAAQVELETRVTTTPPQEAIQEELF